MKLDQEEFTPDQLRGKHHLTLGKALNEFFLGECRKQRRKPADLMRIILEDRYTEVHYPKKVEVRQQGSERQTKREVA